MAARDVFSLFIYLVAIFLFFVAAGFTLYVLYLSYVRHIKYAHIPGPPVKNFLTGHLNEFFVETKRRGLPSAEFELQMLLLYGKVVLLWIYHIPLVVVGSPDIVKETLVTKNYPKSKLLYSTLISLYGQRFLGIGLVTNMDNEDWKVKRRLINPAFHRKYLRFMVPQMNACCDILIKKLTTAANTKTEVNMVNELSRLTLDIICKVGFGVDFKVISDEDAAFTKAFEISLQSANDEMLNFPTPGIFSAFSDKQKKVVKAITYLRETGREVIQKRQEELKIGTDLSLDLLTCILKTCESDNETIAMENLIDEFVTFFFAGHDTTSSLLSFSLMELSDHPKIQERLLDEMNEVLGERTEVEFNDLPNLKYTSLVIKETLRLHPPVLGAPRFTSQDENIGGYRIPKGTAIDVNFYAASRNPDHFEEPLRFMPERWESADLGKSSQYTWTPFSIGPRNCIGQTFAQIEAKVVLTRLLRKFKFSLVPGQTKMVTERLIVRPRDGVVSSLIPRDQL